MPRAGSTGTGEENVASPTETDMQGRNGESFDNARLGELYARAQDLSERLARTLREIELLGGQKPQQDFLADAVKSNPDAAFTAAHRALDPILTSRRLAAVGDMDLFATWCNSHGSALKAAEALYCHRNTVLNKLRGIEGRLKDAGGPWNTNDPLHVAELIMAVRIREILLPGPTPLSPGKSVALTPRSDLYRRRQAHNVTRLPVQHKPRKKAPPVTAAKSH